MRGARVSSATPLRSTTASGTGANSMPPNAWRARTRRGAAHYAAHRPGRLRRLRSHGGARCSQAPLGQPRWAPAFPSPMCPRATPSSSPARWPGRRRLKPRTSSSASTPSIIPAIPDCRPEYLEAFERMAPSRHQGRRGRPRVRPDPRSAAAPHQSRNRQARTRTGTRFRPHLELLRSGPERAPLRRLRLLPAARPGLRGSGRRRSARRTAVKISEIFYSVQGEGVLAGDAFGIRAHQRLQPALHLVRHALHLLDARRRGRAAPAAILEEVRRYPAAHVVVTGGEPMIAPGIVELTRPAARRRLCTSPSRPPERSSSPSPAT